MRAEDGLFRSHQPHCNANSSNPTVLNTSAPSRRNHVSAGRIGSLASADWNLATATNNPYNPFTLVEATPSFTELYAYDSVRANQLSNVDCSAVGLVPEPPVSAVSATVNSSHVFPDHDATDYVLAEGAGTGNCEQELGVPRSLTHLPTYLIQCWSTHICPLWSTFDSGSSYNRQIASTAWSTSAAVFHTLQRMSATYMIHGRPELKAVLPTMTAQATDCIEKEILQLKTSRSPIVRIDLVFAVLALGTSLHWTDCALDASWLANIRMLLDLWRKNMSPSHDLIHAYFRQATVYWQMLMCLISDDITNESFDCRRRKHETSLMVVMGSGEDTLIPHPLPFPDLPPNPEGTLPNSWCGVSCEVIDIFGQVLALCRKARIREKTRTFTLRSSREAICDIMVAKELQQELIALDVQMMMFLDQLFGFTPETGDTTTPMKHLLQTADAYRKASLLQLYLTFDDLEIKPFKDPSSENISTPSNMGNNSGTGSSSSRTQMLSELALQTVSILQEIPLDSGARSIHPILYLAVAPGLKLFAGTQETPDTYDMYKTSWATRNMQTDASASLDKPLDHGTLCTATIQGNVVGDAYAQQSSSLLSPFPSRSEQARDFVQSRMDALRNVLPQRPVAMTLELIHAIWNHSDLARANTRDIHWIDIMMDSTLQTLFR